MNFISKLITSIKEKKSVVCMGLDPRIEPDGQYIPEFIIDQYDDPAKIIIEFNKSLIDATHQLIPIIKPQIAFYEKYDALTALKETIKYAHKKDLLVLLDSKRNDIGSTSSAYAEANFKTYNADACTVNAYLGIDGVKPFMEFKEKGLFILVKTSNPSSSDFQDLFSLKINSATEDITELTLEKAQLKRNYIHMAEFVNRYAQEYEKFQDYTNLGVVAGATHPEALKKIRKILQNSFILIPGYGAQGGTAADIKEGFDSNGLGAIVNSPRGIMFAYKNNNRFSAGQFADAAKFEINKMNKEIRRFINL